MTKHITKLTLCYLFYVLLKLCIICTCFNFSLESSPTQKISAIRCIHEGFRFFLTAYRRNVLPNSISVTLNECFTDLLDSDNLPMETLFNCCYSIVYSLMVFTPALECWNVKYYIIFIIQIKILITFYVVDVFGQTFYAVRFD